MSSLQLKYNENMIEAGCDEAGRGCMAGPVFAAAVILPDDFFHPLLNDSKQMKASDRLLLRAFIEENALAYSVQSSSVEEIDTINILNASFKAMHLAIAALAIRPELLLIDGNRFPAYLGIPHQCIVKGDGKIMSIAAASVLAKTYRDEYMEQIDKEFPAYNWAQNKGYGTLDHRKKICSLGLSPHHRKSFQLKAQLK